MNNLPPTPKGNELKDHFGTMKEMHMYGPQREQRPDRALNVNGYMNDLSKYKTVSKNFIGESPDKE